MNDLFSFLVTAQRLGIKYLRPFTPRDLSVSSQGIKRRNIKKKLILNITFSSELRKKKKKIPQLTLPDLYLSACTRSDKLLFVFQQIVFLFGSISTLKLNVWVKLNYHYHLGNYVLALPHIVGVCNGDRSWQY